MPAIASWRTKRGAARRRPTGGARRAAAPASTAALVPPAARRALAAVARAAVALTGLAALAVPAAALAQTGVGVPAPTARALAPLVDGPFVGVLPCADCAGIRTELTLYRSASSGAPAFFHLRRTYLGKDDTVFESQGPWTESGGAEPRLRIDPQREDARLHLRRRDAATLELLDRDERPLDTRASVLLVRRAGRIAQPAPPRPFFAGTVQALADGQVAFRPCRDAAVVRLVDATTERALAALVTELAGAQRRPLYFEGWGRLRDGRLLVEQLNRVGAELACAPAGTLQAVRWQAQGNEPGWALASRGASIALTEPGGVAWRAPDVPLSWSWSSSRPERVAEVELRADGLRVDVAFEPGLCRDTMAEVAYGWRAEARIQPAAGSAEPRLMSGCAYLGERTRLP